MITFSFRPSSRSTLPSIEASVSTFVVSWKDAAERKDSVASDAFVIPRISGSKVAWLDVAARLHQQARPARQLVLLRLVLFVGRHRVDDHLRPALGLLDGDLAADLRESGCTLGIPGLEDLDHAWEAMRDVRTGD